MYRLIYTESYEKRARRFIKKHPEMENQYKKALTLLELNPRHPSLRLHQFSKRSASLFSVSINMSYRIALEFEISGEDIILIDVGDHREIYG